MAKNKDVAQKTRMYRTGPSVRDIFEERKRSPLEIITECICDMRNMDTHYKAEYSSYEAMHKDEDRAEKEAQKVLEMYNTIIEQISLIHIKDYGLLLEILRFLGTFYPLHIFSYAIRKHKVAVPEHSKPEELMDVLRNLSSWFGLHGKYQEFLYAEFERERKEDIARLDKLGEKIIDKKEWYDWYCNNKYENWRWRELADYEKSSHSNNPYPWRSRYSHMHRLKTNMSFSLMKGQKIVILHAGDYQDAKDIVYREYEKCENTYTESSYQSQWWDIHRDRTCVAIQHIGSINNTSIEIMTLEEFKIWAQEHNISNKVEKYLSF